MKKIIFVLSLWSLSACVFAQNKADSISEETVNLQVFLDNKNFSPGKIDGLKKQFTLQALEQYKKANHVDGTNDIETITPLYVQYKIRDEYKNIGTVPETPKAQAKKKRMPYATVAELVAERFHTDTKFLAKLNPDKNMKKLKPGDELKVPNVHSFNIEEIKKETLTKKKKEFSKRTIKINAKDHLLSIYDKGALVASFPISAGSKQLPAPKGVWKLTEITYLPWFRYDKKMLKEGQRSRHFYMIPPGPNSAVGVVWISLNKMGIGIHGTDTPETIGKATSHGCIRLTNWDVIKLSNMITPGIKVQID